MVNTVLSISKAGALSMVIDAHDDYNKRWKQL